MPPDAAHSLPSLCSALRKACASDKALKRTAQEVEQLLEGIANESTLSTVAAGLSTLATPSSDATSLPLVTLALAHAQETLAVLAEVLKLGVEGLRAVVGKTRDRAELGKGEKGRVEAWEGIVVEVLSVLEGYFEAEDRPHKVTDEEKDKFSVCLHPLAELLKLDLEVRKLRSSILRTIFDLSSSATSRHPANKTRLTQLSILGPLPLAQLLFHAADSAVTAEALELAFRLGEHVGNAAKDEKVKERWAGQVWPEKAFGKKGAEGLTKSFSELTVATYNEKSPAILNVLSKRSSNCFKLLPCLRLAYTKRTFVHSVAPRASAAAGSFDGPVSLNRATFSATTAEFQEGEEEAVESVFEFRWEAVERVEVKRGQKSVTATIHLSAPPTLDSTLLEAGGAVQLELKLNDLELFQSVLKARKVPIGPPSHPVPPVATAPRSAPAASTSKAKGTTTPAPWATAAPESAPPLSSRRSKFEKANTHQNGAALFAAGGGLEGPRETRETQVGRGEKRAAPEEEGRERRGELDHLFSPAPEGGRKKQKKRPSPLELFPAARTSKNGGLLQASDAHEGTAQGEKEKEEEDEEFERLSERVLRGLSEGERRAVVRELLNQEGEGEEGVDGAGEGEMEVEEGGGLETLLNPPPHALTLGAHFIAPPPAPAAAALFGRSTSPSTAVRRHTHPSSALRHLSTAKKAAAPANEKGAGKAAPAQAENGQKDVAADVDGAATTLDPSLDASEQAVSTVLSTLSSVILSSFSLRRLDAAAHLSREQAALAGKVRSVAVDEFAANSSAIFNLASSAHASHSAVADSRVLPALRACGEESAKAVERVREML
ncbi:hypothetical protein JCM6882_005559 [Rhodosporidiobolus microsporus]